MKRFLTSVLILSATASAFADHTAFVPKPAASPVVKSTNSARMPSRYQPYTRNQPHFERAKPAMQNEASNQPSSRYPAYSRNNPRF